MAINVNIEAQKPNRILNYPKLVRSKTSGTVYLLTGPSEGTVLLPGSDLQSVGLYSQDWVFLDGCEDFEGSLVLSNLQE